MQEKRILSKFTDFVKGNKPAAILIAIGIMLIIAIITTLIVVTFKDSTPPDDGAEEVGGVEVSAYYYDVAGGEVVLSLRNNHKFTLTGPELSKSGSYTIKDGKITLDFVRDKDGVSEGTVSGNKISLVLNDATITFHEKVYYTVTFDFGDGVTDTVKVVNGKTVNPPEPPLRGDAEVEGWFFDTEYTKPFLFGGMPISKDTTLYAKWSPVSGIGE